MDRSIVIDYENRRKLGDIDKTITHLVDANGNRMLYINYKGYIYPRHMPLPVDVRLQQIKDFECRDDNIIISSYPKSVHYGSWFDHVKTWSTSTTEFPKLNVLYLPYEDLKENLYGEIVKIVRFLGLSYEERFLRQVEERCTFRSMQHGVKTEVGQDDRWTYLKTLEKGHLPIYRKGEVGEWKNWLTLAQNEEFDAVIERELQNTGLAYRYESQR